ncbi:MAG: SIMPL domain-containing protein [Acidobacteriota bacterium]|nr:SIMPL domain-containing protein [Acidobacteriota bacterium]
MKMNMRNSMIAVGTAIMILSGTIALTVAAEAPATPNGNANKITVNGHGVVKVTPDIAYITLGVMTQEHDAVLAQDTNSKTMAKVIEAVKGQGVANKDIKTSNYRMSQYEYNEGQEKIIWHHVTNSMTVTVRNIDSVGKVIDAGVAAGANDANNIQFDLSDAAGFHAQALTLAVENAKQKGAVIAKALGVIIGNPYEVTESGGYYAPMTGTTLNTRAAMNVAADNAMPVQSTELEISTNVTCVFGY